MLYTTTNLYEGEVIKIQRIINYDPQLCFNIIDSQTITVSAETKINHLLGDINEPLKGRCYTLANFTWTNQRWNLTFKFDLKLTMIYNYKFQKGNETQNNYPIWVTGTNIRHLEAVNQIVDSALTISTFPQTTTLPLISSSFGNYLNKVVTNYAQEERINTGTFFFRYGVSSVTLPQIWNYYLIFDIPKTNNLNIRENKINYDNGTLTSKTFEGGRYVVPLFNIENETSILQVSRNGTNWKLISTSLSNSFYALINSSKWAQLSQYLSGIDYSFPSYLINDQMNVLTIDNSLSFMCFNQTQKPALSLNNIELSILYDKSFPASPDKYYSSFNTYNLGMKLNLFSIDFVLSDLVKEIISVNNYKQCRIGFKNPKVTFELSGWTLYATKNPFSKTVGNNAPITKFYYFPITATLLKTDNVTDLLTTINTLNTGYSNLINQQRFETVNNAVNGIMGIASGGVGGAAFAGPIGAVVGAVMGGIKGVMSAGMNQYAQAVQRQNFEADARTQYTNLVEKSRAVSTTPTQWYKLSLSGVSSGDVSDFNPIYSIIGTANMDINSNNINNGRIASEWLIDVTITPLKKLTNIPLTGKGFYHIRIDGFTTAWDGNGNWREILLPNEINAIEGMTIKYDE